MSEEMQCRLCGCKFDPNKTKSCGCQCAFGGCNGRNVRCPNCGHDMPRENPNQTSFIDKIKTAIKH